MGRIAKTFKRLSKEGKKALIPFITAGDPSLSATERLVYALEQAGADIIELGVPFSDPTADGPVIQASSERAIGGGTTLNRILGIVRRIRRSSEIPLVLMSYYNPVWVMGIGEFARKAKAAGVDAVLVVDLPPEEARELRRELSKKRIDQIFLVAPTSHRDRVERALKYASGFLYYVSMTGVTGTPLQFNQSLKTHLQWIRSRSRLPVVIGFGITGPEQIGKVAILCDGIVVGSALVRLIDSHRAGNKIVAKTSAFLSSLRKSLNRIHS